MTSIRRRRLLQGAAAGSLLLPLGLRRAFGQAPALLRTPRRALVIGNSRYKANPLRNPVNDARAMAEKLKRTGFEVSLGLDLDRAAMLEAIRGYSDALGATKPVGLFFFAGHGVQFSWRNYVLPTDAVAERMEDIQKSCVDINTVLEGIKRAGNPMNVIVLDACRNNPFGSDFLVEQKGLSQVDAPPGTLLAYATAPGNVASDGEGANGLYTEHLVEQIGTPEAKIEDVFKRVRLRVRRRSNGLQIPWESTSLEEDFWFIPPKELKRLSEEEAERELKEELARRERAEAERAAAAERARREELARQERIKAEREAEAERARREELALLARIEAEKEAQAEQALKAELARQERIKAEKEAEAERARKEGLALRERIEAEKLAEAERKRTEERELRERVKAATKADPEREFKEELALWERIQASSEPAALEDYLLRHPSGRFSELAQLQLDRVLARQGEKKIEIVSSPQNPYSKGTAAADTRYKLGDSYTYNALDLYTKLQTRTFTQTVTQITDTEVIFNDGRFITDLLGNPVRTGDGRRLSPNQNYPQEFAVGRRWISRFEVATPKGAVLETEIEFRIVARERVSVPAGGLNAYRVEGSGFSTSSTMRFPVQTSLKTWFAPEQVRRPIASETLRRVGNRIVVSERMELVAFKQS